MPPSGDPERTVRTVTVRGLDFRVHEAGPVRAHQVFVLVHGIGMSHRYLRRLQVSLATDALVLTLDLPGFGSSPRPKRPISIPEMATALGQLLGMLLPSRAVLVGHSMGTQWITELSILEPALVSGAVLIGPVTDRRRRALSAHLLRLAADCTREPADANALIFGDYLRCGLVWYLRQARAMIAYPLEDRLADVSVPVLVARGARDPIAPHDWCLLLAARAVSGRLLTIPHHSHAVQHTAAPALAGALRAFADAAL
ncbi:alpha/beta fold hydrolase [Pseudoclavibacter sp. RFBA6]|uniref:alpha/beta fold hydrolase n=1 Tax=Pseudoclavibacter sp. RFBA6 TaxID=2080573 RepID=UPI000CE77AE3|nr:alpha/beta fold hydrolase [Pseudoclavibacter sp. RFBA6]PPG41489.1 alpha/beta hydrolase [Pseudoclavibacter sp. RFBA6]